MKNRKAKSLAKSKVRKCFKLGGKLFTRVIEVHNGSVIVEVDDTSSLYNPFIVEVKGNVANVLFYDHIAYMPYKALS